MDRRIKLLIGAALVANIQAPLQIVDKEPPLAFEEYLYRKGKNVPKGKGEKRRNKETRWH